MTRFLLVAAMACAAIALSAPSCNLLPVVEAQTLPVTKQAAIDPNAVTDAVTSYTFVLDAGAPIIVGPTIDVTCGCIQTPFVIATAGPHAFTVTATNLWGTSPAASFAFTVKLAATPVNPRIR